MALRGSLQALRLYDVADGILLDELRVILGLGDPERLPQFARPAPAYVRFEHPPVIQQVAATRPGGNGQRHLRAKYYDYGVLSIESICPFECDWASLVAQSIRWMDAPEAEAQCREQVEHCLGAAGRALVNPYPNWLSEEYYIIHLREAEDRSGGTAQASDLLATHATEIAQIVRAESSALSESERLEVLQSRVSYYPTDLALVGWEAAFVYDTPEGAAPLIQLLEYANAQLLEYRHYDQLLSQVLGEVNQSLEHRRGRFSQWRLAREAERLNTIRLEVMEIAERTDNSIKFLSDMFYARLYRLAAAKVGVQDYRNVVDRKLQTAAEVYRSMVDQFQESRAFLLELIVILILLIEIILAVRGRPY
jgi:hypothetical protein